MAKSSNRTVLDLCRNELARVGSLLEQRDYEKARAACVRVLGDLDEHGLASCAAFRLYGVALDYLGQPREALAAVEKGLEVDPLSPDADRSRDVILHRLRASVLASPPGVAADEALRRYDLLRDRGEASVEVHLAVARLHMASSNREDARKILGALTALHPGTAEAWELLEELGCADDKPRIAKTSPLLASVDDQPDPEAAYDELYENVCAIGSALAETGGFELPDEWSNLVRDWLLENRPGVVDRGVTEADVQEAFAAWEIGAHRE